MVEFGASTMGLKGEEKPALRAGGSILGAQAARSTRCRSEPNCFKDQSYQGPDDSKKEPLNVAGSQKASRLFLTTLPVCSITQGNRVLAQAYVPCSLPTYVH